MRRRFGLAVRRLERALLGAVMLVVALVLERRLARAIEGRRGA